MVDIMKIDTLIKAIHENDTINDLLCGVLRNFLFFYRWDELQRLLDWGEITITFFTRELNAYNDGLALMSFPELVREMLDIGVP